MKIIHETDVEETKVPGRFLRWIAKDNTGLDPEFCSSCVMRVEPGFTVSPAHSHPEGEELIYIIEGEGKVYVDGIIKKMQAGTAVLFEKGSIHMVRNSGKIPMKVICFFAPKTSLEEYEFHPEIDFDGGVEEC
ncbi:MAG: cupin domain-containing protein [Sphaerochaetaceae bacterium]|nr:cupin domain-containing protein [Sphaerochaetaceae bacterium]MDC7247943.1 cupin domain-containing protein [Sphaerochaetaceae bacterium]